MSVVKTRGRPPKNLKLTTASITSNDSNHSTASKVKRTTRTNGHGKFELKSEDEIYNFDEASPKASKRNRNGANCKQKIKIIFFKIKKIIIYYFIKLHLIFISTIQVQETV